MPSSPTKAPVQPRVQATPTAGLANIYTDNLVDFSFAYPADFIATSSGDSPDRSVVVAKAGSDQVFQLETKSWNDPEQTVTVERIRHDAPQMDIRDPQPVTILGAVRGVAFLSSAPLVPGDVRQAWFIMNGRLYQFTAPVTADDLLGKVVESFVAGNAELNSQ